MSYFTAEKMHQISFLLGLCPTRSCQTLQSPPESINHLAVFKAAYF